jgi:hypothetical protein
VSPTPATQLATFIARFDPKVAAVIRGARSRLRRHFPTATELVYDNYSFLVIGYSATARPSDCIVSLAASASGVVLSFYHGAGLPDPQRVLLGTGVQNRYVRLATAATLGEPTVLALLRAATDRAKTPLARQGRGPLVIQSVSAKQRPRRIT